MALPASVQYLGMRLRPLAKPIIWCPALVLVLLGVFLWEYRNHPDWSDQFAVDEPTPNAGTLLSEEEVLADQPLATNSDSERTGFMKLLEDLGFVGNDRQSTAVSEDAPADQGNVPDSLLDLLSDPSSASEGDGDDGETFGRRQLAGTSNPFDRYLDDYQLPGSANLSSNNQATLTDSSAGIDEFLRFLNFNQGDGGSETAQGTDTSTTPLERAINNRQNQAATDAEDTQNPAPASDAESPDAADATAQARGENPAVVPGTIPGVPTFIQTTPQMSPAPGTTGYTTPPSLNLTVPQATTGNGTVGSSAVGSPIQPTVPSGVSGATLPPTSGTQYTTPQFTSQPPFSAPRPPSQYLGNGQIQTFSNPLGGSTWEPSDYVDRQ